MFRHADGNVLAEVLPVLDEPQFARLLGPARAVTFLAPDLPSACSGSVLRRAVRPEGAAKAASGFLRLMSEQMEGVEKARLERLKSRLVTYLRKVTGDELKDTPDAAVRVHVDECVWTAADFRFRPLAKSQQDIHSAFHTFSCPE